MRWLIVFMIGCSAPRAPSPVASGPRCTQVAAHAVGLLDAKQRAEWVAELRADGLFPDGAEEQPALVTFLARACVEVAWPEDVRRCMVAQSSWDAIEARCEKQAWWYSRAQ
jgi:hypothetical protein